ncbi:hypothetical protein BH11BAC2_BH11BAC2_21550 [soil metagenome]
MKSELNRNSSTPKVIEGFFSKQLIQVVLVALFAFLLRVYHLNFQSLWLDELYTMCIADPTHSVKEILNGLKTDFHPPLHYFLAHYYFRLVGFSDFTGRLLSVFIGIAGVIAIYFLGREMKDHRMGIIMALVTAVNFYHVFHSQEVRMYILLFLFAIVSVIFCLRAIRRNTWQEYIKFIILTVLLLYTHYFGMFVFVGELFWMTMMVLFFKSADFKKVFISCLAVVTFFLPWIPYILTASHRSHWMPAPKPWFFFNYLFDYTGRDPVVSVLFLLGLVLFLRRLIQLYRNKENEKLAGYLLLSCLLFFVYIPPYLISQFKPVVQLRCTISGLPFLIAAMILGLESLGRRWSVVLYTLVMVSALINLFFIRNYYATNTKEDFRSLAQVVDHLDVQEPVVSHYALQFNYYFRQLHSGIAVIDPDSTRPEDVLKNSRTFYVLNAHSNENLMTLSKYKNWQDYVKMDFVADTIYKSTFGKKESAVRFTER